MFYLVAFLLGFSAGIFFTIGVISYGMLGVRRDFLGGSHDRLPIGKL